MNRENIEKLMKGMHDYAVPSLGFDMGTYHCGNPTSSADSAGHICKTTACGAGWAVALFDGEAELKRLAAIDVEDVDGDLINACHARAREILGLTGEQAFDLFSDQTSPSVTMDDFIAACQHLLEHGRVAWPTLLDEDEEDGYYCDDV